MKDLHDIIKDEVFLEKLTEAKTAGEFVDLLAGNNITLDGELTPDEAFRLFKENEGSELKEDDLENVNGGILISTGIMAACALTASAGFICFLGGYAYQTVKNARRKK